MFDQTSNASSAQMVDFRCIIFPSECSSTTNTSPPTQPPTTYTPPTYTTSTYTPTTQTPTTYTPPTYTQSTRTPPTTVTPPTCIPSPPPHTNPSYPSITFSTNCDFCDHDLYTLTCIPNAFECASLCANDRKCTHFTYIANLDGGTCRLKSAPGSGGAWATHVPSPSYYTCGFIPKRTYSSFLLSICLGLDVGIGINWWKNKPLWNGIQQRATFWTILIVVVEIN